MLKMSFLLTLVLTASIAAGQAPGTVDTLNAAIVGDDMAAMAVQRDGKVIIAGLFTSVMGIPRRNIARLNADGTLDLGFNPGVDNRVDCMVVQTDGKIVLGGCFDKIQANGAATQTKRRSIARINADGSLDPGFDPNVDNRVTSLALQPDGKLLIGGFLNSLQPNGAPQPTVRLGVARVNPDGSLDAGFDPRADGGVGEVSSIVIQPDGKILLGGSFTTLQPNGAATATDRMSVARVNSDGSLDAMFDPKANGSVYGVTIQPNGKILLGGKFTTLQPNGAAKPVERQNIARVNSDGSVDMGFNPRADDAVFSTVVQADGKIVVGGWFSNLQPNGAAFPVARHCLARINPNGSLDPGFDPAPDNYVYGVALQPDGKILLRGQFATIGKGGATTPTERRFFARLHSPTPSGRNR